MTAAATPMDHFVKEDPKIDGHAGVCLPAAGLRKLPPPMLPHGSVCRNAERRGEDAAGATFRSLRDLSPPPAPRSHRHRSCSSDSSCSSRCSSASSTGGSHSPSGASRRLERQTVTAPFWPSGDCAQTSCSVCIESFAEGDYLRTLPCMHRYHVQCVDNWFAASSSYTCPMCKYQIS
ncbi:unnamed protein product [Polarella glacialis]|uniref:RING-type domain-containing protein n=1 Tax=Polarella glacialis TaxID=89957 RepID=A0A813IHZ1_POLGL|nr:unnamed protein product [Polarella glacialis]|mmetsp:Transcript_69442/g.111941  ORF Transcript_69442/g.111941 Transcript_69442/m.111941 type:complete len:177 (-) Transcript_69442:190-720(-)